MEGGFVPVIAHPERYENGNARQAIAWREAGARLQVNCGSLLGQYKPGARDRAWQLLAAGAVDFLASDYHARGLYPLDACARLLEEHGGARQVELMLKVNPSRLARNEDPLDVPAIERPSSLLRRLARGLVFR
jgi:tyrosine-protein phosphatase YwqE